MDVSRRTDVNLPPAVPRVDAERVDATSRDELLFAAVESALMPMVVCEARAPDNPVVTANAAFLAMSGYALSEIVGHDCRFLQGADTDPVTVAAIHDALRDRRAISQEILNYRKDGSAFWNALYIAPVFDRNGDLRYFWATQLDVTHRHDIELALGHAQKMEALGQLTGGISHDFNNLLQVMLGQVDLLDRRLRADTVDPKAIGAASQSMRAAIGKASTLTHQLLAFARKQNLEGRLSNLNELAGRLSDLIARTLGADVKVVMELAAGLDDCRIDPSQFEQALLNILVNARDAMQGSGTVTLQTSNVVIEAEDLRSFAGLEAGRYASIAISDTGPGIPREIVHRVMEPFFTTKDEGKGTGLGLSMVHGFARQSGGGVQIYSDAGLGTTIRLYFPVADDDGVRPAEAPRPLRERGGGERVLVVDDRLEVLDVATGLLAELGYRVSSAGSGAEALRLMESLPADERPVLLFSDVIMPGGMNGYMLARKLREQSPGLRVLLTTGYAGDVQQGMGPGAAGEFEVIKKPYKLDELARRVRRAIDLPAG